LPGVPRVCRTFFLKRGLPLTLAAVPVAVVLFIAFSPLIFKRLRVLEGSPQIPPSASILGNYSHWAVSTDAALCAPVARKVQLTGGTIADVAVATLLCMGVVLPQSMGMGGGFLATVYTRYACGQKMCDRKNGATYSLMSQTPVISNTEWGLSVAVPGEIRGYQALLQRMGTNLTWRALFEDAIRLARDGFPIHLHLADALRVKKNAIYSYRNMRQTFWNVDTNDTLKEGHLLVQKDLAASLELIAENGPDHFYEGAFAEQLVREVNENGGNMTLEDISSYEVAWDDPVNVSFKDDLVMYSVPPPGSGAVLSYIMNIMDAFRTDGNDTLEDNVLTLHRFLEACKFAYGKRALLGDPNFVDLGQLVHKLTSRQHALAARKLIDDSRTFDDPALYSGRGPFRPDHGTAHASFLSPNGDAIAVTGTVNYYFGSMVSSGGVVLNNQMDDFSVPGVTDQYTVAPLETNFVAPGKRPLSSMAPAVVVDQNGDAQLVLGGAGGTKITSGIALVSMRYLWQGNTIKEAIDFPRVHHQFLPNHVYAEAMFPKAYREQLEKKGHKVFVPGGTFSNIMGISQREGRIYANADYRKRGTVDGE
ncbi:unnamed protein product, partial [Ixodes hexagonus]